MTNPTPSAWGHRACGPPDQVSIAKLQPMEQGDQAGVAVVQAKLSTIHAPITRVLRGKLAPTPQTGPPPVRSKAGYGCRQVKDHKPSQAMLVIELAPAAHRIVVDQSASATSWQLQPLSKRMIALARRAARASLNPSRAKARSSSRSASVRKPPRNHAKTRIRSPSLGKTLLGCSGSRGIAASWRYARATHLCTMREPVLVMPPAGASCRLHRFEPVEARARSECVVAGPPSFDAPAASADQNSLLVSAQNPWRLTPSILPDAVFGQVSFRNGACTTAARYGGQSF